MNNIKRVLFTLMGLLLLIIGQMSISTLGVGKTSYAQVNTGATINIPGDRPTIQQGIDLANDGDIVLIAPGTYNENILMDGKTITLASWFHTTGQEQYIEQTIIDGDGDNVIDVGTVGEETRIIGLTIRNGEDGISVNSRIYVLNNRIVGNADGIDYERGGGVCSNNLFAYNTDDGVDLDGPTEVTVTDNIIRDNDDDGIEIRLHAYSGDLMDIIIRDNLISGNQEDGIQLIDYPDLSDRIFRVERNVFVGNAIAAIGFMEGGNTTEDLNGAAIPERVFVTNNTFVAESYGVVGGANVIVLNNIFRDVQNSALRRVSGDSIAAHNMLWNNGTDYEETNIDLPSTRFTDPLLNADYSLTANSPAMDTGTATFIWQGETVMDMPGSSYNGPAPDVGAFESEFDGSCEENNAIETCDGIDNDCNADTGDGSGESWYGGSCDGPDTDLCNEGIYDCINGIQSCSDITGDTGEVCSDGIDNDCDGTVDEINIPEPRTISIHPVADVLVNNGNPDRNYGTDLTLAIEGSPEKIAYLRFDVAGLSGPVQSARLRLEVVDRSSSGGTVHSISDNNWDENTVTFDTRPDMDSPDLDTLGVVEAGDIVEFDVTAAIGGNGTYSFAIVSDDSNKAEYRSREDLIHPPVLIITIRDEGVPYYCDDDSDGHVDMSGDGTYLANGCIPEGCETEPGNDCDDSNPGIISERMWYADNDADSYGDANSAILACSQPEGYVTDNTDCNDSDPGTFSERMWYADSDADTHGDANSTMQACSQPEGYVIDNTDCNDNDSSIHPEAVEICDGTDNDCNADTGDGSGESWYGGSCDGPDTDLCSEGIYECINGMQSCADITGDIDEVCSDGIDNDCDGTVDEIDILESLTVNINPAADVLVNDGNSDQNYGSDLTLGIEGSPEKIAYLRFDVTGLSRPVQSARLRLEVVDRSSSGGTIHTISDNSWDENTVTFDTRPDIDGPALDSLGVVETGDVAEFDVTAAIGENGTYSFAIVSDDSNKAEFRSREDSIHPPVLIITIRDDGVPYYCDDDSDGYVGMTGHGNNTSNGCIPDECETAPGNDCDDSNAVINPAAVEVCDAIDNDCDGTVDEDLSQPTTCGVGACSDNAGIEICSDGVWGGNTCDPFAGAIREGPFGSLSCFDSIDNDCDGFTDSDDPECVPVTLEVQVSAGSDDAEESDTGNVSLSSSDLELVLEESNQTIGIRFNEIDIPPGATIHNAYIQFTADETQSGLTILTIEGEATDNAQTFTRTNGDISSRVRTAASVGWTPDPWLDEGDAGFAQQTPDIASLIQEVVNNPNWINGNSLVIIITGEGKRVAESYNGSAAPVLHVEHSVN